jgi:hypothetical protein
MTAVIKCRRTCCERKTRDPKAAGWGYISEAPPEVPHWIGWWWCPSCFTGLRDLMASIGVEPVVERLQ